MKKSSPARRGSSSSAAPLSALPYAETMSVSQSLDQTKAMQ
jgi:hypothetical protein